MPTKKSLGQHWLKDKEVLASIASEANLQSCDTVLEIGPGLGTLTSHLLKGSEQVVAVELDADLARKLPGQFPGKNLQVFNEDILDFDLSILPAGYKVVANVPYYITSKIIQKLMTDSNPPSVVVVLIQKEVAERLVAADGDLSILAISAAIFAEAKLGPVVPAAFFTPPPKVDSQVVVLIRRNKPLVSTADQTDFFRVVKAGFSSKRKKIKTSLAGGLGVSKECVGKILVAADISPDVRAENLTIQQWIRLVDICRKELLLKN